MYIVLTWTQGVVLPMTKVRKVCHQKLVSHGLLLRAIILHSSAMAVENSAISDLSVPRIPDFVNMFSIFKSPMIATLTKKLYASGIINASWVSIILRDAGFSCSLSLYLKKSFQMSTLITVKIWMIKFYIRCPFYVGRVSAVRAPYQIL